jgi:hypothetical protein
MQIYFKECGALWAYREKVEIGCDSMGRKLGKRRVEKSREAMG